MYLWKCSNAKYLEEDIAPEEWARDLVNETIEYCLETSEPAVGTVVLEVEEDDEGEPIFENGKPRLVADRRYGVVAVNWTKFDAEMWPFKGREHHIYDVRRKPEISFEDILSGKIPSLYRDIPSTASEGYPDDGLDENGDIIDTADFRVGTKQYDRQYIETMADLVMVRWFNDDGSRDRSEFNSVTWHRRDSLAEVRE
jgi:hypothetical protein